MTPGGRWVALCGGRGACSPGLKDAAKALPSLPYIPDHSWINHMEFQEERASVGSKLYWVRFRPKSDFHTESWKWADESYSEERGILGYAFQGSGHSVETWLLGIFGRHYHYRWSGLRSSIPSFLASFPKYWKCSTDLLEEQDNFIQNQAITHMRQWALRVRVLGGPGYYLEILFMGFYLMTSLATDGV